MSVCLGDTIYGNAELTAVDDNTGYYWDYSDSLFIESSNGISQKS